MEKKILLVDDERLVLRSIEKTLLRAGFDVETAHDTSTGLALFEEALAGGEPFGVAILDLQMPNLQGQNDPNAGLELLSELIERDAALPVVVLTAFDQVRSPTSPLPLARCPTSRAGNRQSRRQPATGALPQPCRCRSGRLWRLGR